MLFLDELYEEHPKICHPEVVSGSRRCWTKFSMTVLEFEFIEILNIFDSIRNQKRKES
jgi:hypothetical protein